MDDKSIAQILPVFMELLRNAPAYGSCGIEIILVDSQMFRVITKKDVSLKPGVKTG